ncbi:MAG: MBOAT family protein [Bacteroidales bacterium]|nr:MBOAT family protein [Bacteroidales bacterium]
MLSILEYSPTSPLLFNTGLFIFFFLTFIAGYTLLSGRRTTPLRLLYVTAFSYYFYYKNAGAWCMLLAVITLVNFFCAIGMERSGSQQARKRWMWTAVGFMLAQLAFFKYTNWVLSTLAGFTLLPADTQLDLPMLIGISFFTFQSMSYIIDVYRRQMPATRSLTDFAFFVSFFPTLLAGPILRARTFLPQLRQPIHITHQMMGSGTWFIIMGLFKKCIISDYISQNFVSRIFDNPALYSGLENLLGVYGYALQLYCDFSGYSDMAIGIALWMGFSLPPNFRAPYKSDSITDFWRRWHISLSSWLRDYLYISMGGNRCSRWRMYFNQFMTMLLGGLWHGASWNFVIWGSVHGVALCLHKAWQQLLGHDKHYHPTGLRRVLAVVLTFHLVCFSWLFFAGSSFESSAAMLTQIFTNFQPQLITQFVAGYPEVTALMTLGFVLHFLPTRLNERTEALMGRTPSILLAVLLALTIIWVIQVKGSEIQPFIYFKF